MCTPLPLIDGSTSMYHSDGTALETSFSFCFSGQVVYKEVPRRKSLSHGTKNSHQQHTSMTKPRWPSLLDNREQKSQHSKHKMKKPSRTQPSTRPTTMSAAGKERRSLKTDAMTSKESGRGQEKSTTTDKEDVESSRKLTPDRNDSGKPR